VELTLRLTKIQHIKCVKKQICCLHDSCRFEVHDSISINKNVADPKHRMLCQLQEAEWDIALVQRWCLRGSSRTMERTRYGGLVSSTYVSDKSEPSEMKGGCDIATCNLCNLALMVDNLEGEYMYL
jgi:hypothetical protein